MYSNEPALLNVRGKARTAALASASESGNDCDASTRWGITAPARSRAVTMAHTAMVVAKKARSRV